VEELQQRLDGLETSASSEHSTNLQLASRLAKVKGWQLEAQPLVSMNVQLAAKDQYVINSLTHRFLCG
jgi:hypothetical protein